MPEGMEGTVEVPTGTEAAPAAPESQAPATSEATGSTESGAPATSVLDIDSYRDHVVTVKVGGEEHQVPLSEALEGHMRHADYTRKSQEVAERRREIEAYESLQAAFTADPKGTLEALARQAGIDFGSVQTSIEELDPEEARIRGLEKFVQDENQRRAQEQLDSTVVSLREKYGDDAVDEHELFDFAVKRGFTVATLEDAFKALHYDKAVEKARSAAAAEREQGESDRTDAKGSLPPVAGGATNGGPVAAGAKPVGTLREAWALAREQLGAS